MKRVLILPLLILSILMAPLPALAQTAPQANPLAVVVDSLQTSANSYQVGTRITATTTLRAGSNVVLPMLVLAAPILDTPGAPDLGALAQVMERYAMRMDFDSMPRLIAEHGLDAPPET